MVVLLACVCFAAVANAAPAWYVADVNMVGASGSTVNIKLTHSAQSPVFTEKWFTVPPDASKEVLATALTAVTNGMQVLMAADLSLGGDPPILGFYVLP